MSTSDATKTPPGKATPEELFACLDRLGIAYSVRHHPPVFTVEEAKHLRGEIEGAHCKSLFLRDKKGTMWLLVCLEWRRIDLKALQAMIGARGRLSFGSAERLSEYLGVIPGAVTPFAAINDRAAEGPNVQIVLDAEMMDAPSVNYHPLVNNQTVNLLPDGLRAFLADFGHTPLEIDLGGATVG